MLELMKIKLKNCSEYVVKFSAHCIFDRFIIRDITEDEVKTQIFKTEELIDVIEEESKYSDEKKYKFVFQMTKNKTFLIVVAINDEKKEITIITAIKRPRKWVRAVERRN